MTRRRKQTMQEAADELHAALAELGWLLLHVSGAIDLAEWLNRRLQRRKDRQ